MNMICAVKRFRFFDGLSLKLDWTHYRGIRGVWILLICLVIVPFYNTLMAQTFEEVGRASELAKSSHSQGMSVADYDKDGDLDIFIVSKFLFDESDPQTWNRLFRNDGDGNFTDVTIEANLDKQTSLGGGGKPFMEDKLGASWGDYDNDGYPDLFIALFGYDKLYHNNGDGTFTNVSETAGIKGCTDCYSSSPLWWDFDKDGDLDLYVSDFAKSNRMYENLGAGIFEDVTERTGLADVGGKTWTSLPIDANDDGWLDLYVANDGTPNTFFINMSGEYFEEKTTEYGLENDGNGMGIAIGDYDNDGNFDIYVTNIHYNLPNPLFVNKGNGEGFVDKAEELGVENTGWGWGTEFFDADNDGDLDLAAAAFDLRTENFLFENTMSEGQEGFRDHSRGSGIRGFNNSFGLTTFDYDMDGDLDVLIGNWESQPYLFRNLADEVRSQKNNSWLQVKLEGTASNRDAYGTKLKVVVGDKEYHRFYHGGELLGQSPKPVHFGLAAAKHIDELHIEWPNGLKEVFHDLEVNRLVTIVEETSIVSEELIGDDSGIVFEGLGEYSMARQWNEELLNAIRNDFARPTVHARNLFHTAIAMYDVWATYDEFADTYLLGREDHGFTSEFSGISTPENVEEARDEALSYAVYRLLTHRFASSPGATGTIRRLRALMEQMDYDIAFTSTDYTTGEPAALGNYIAETIIAFGNQDGSNEENGYENKFYNPVNPSMVPSRPGTNVEDPNRWQPLTLDIFIDQSGNVIPVNTPEFLGPEWGEVTPFALSESDLTIKQKDGNEYWVYNDPGTPPEIILDAGGGLTEEYKWGFSLVSVWSAQLDHENDVQWDISPGAIGNIDIADFPKTFEKYDEFYNLNDGGDISQGRSINPKTGQPYEAQMVPRGDYGRVLAEFWADGPDSETPPGHWFTLLNYVSDHPDFVKRYGGEGRILSDLEWDVKSYMTLGGAMHDAAITAWGIKGWYDYIRPVSAIRYMAGEGQSSDVNKPSYSPNGIPLMDGYIELVTENDALVGDNNENLNKIKLYAWKGPDYIQNPDIDVAGVDWILAENWWPYQRPSFVTPPFAGYISGHSTFSRAAAEVMTLMTGDEYFPGGMGEFLAPKNEFLVFEEGPSVDVTLQWATYRDASDQCSLSRIWGGIHPPADDIPGRILGEKIGIAAYNHSRSYFNNVITSIETQPSEITFDFKVYPNPSKNSEDIIIEFDEKVTTELLLEIIDSRGNSLRQKQATLIGTQNKVSISSQNLPGGFYIVRVKTNKGTYNKKILVDR